jgi:beta-glucosidase
VFLGHYPHGAEMQNPASGYTAMGWEVFPHGLNDILKRFHHDYAPKAIYVAENGAAYDDQVVAGEVNDEARRAYLEAHLAAAEQAMAEGVPLVAYLVWSLLDNYEWGWGYSRRFGIVHVDYETQRRTPKKSALWYRDYIGRWQESRRKA